MFNLKKIKYLIIGIVIGSLTSTPFVYATNTVKLIVNGEDITYKSDVPPQIVNGRTLVPARALAESLGATVEWDGENNAVIVKSDNYNKHNNNLTMRIPPIQKTSITNKIKWNNMEIIELNGETYFLASDYSDKIRNSSSVTMITNIETNEIIIKSNDSVKIINNSNSGWISHLNRTYINCKHYIQP